MYIRVSDHFFTLSESAKELGVERHSIRRWVNEGKIEGQRIGGILLIEKNAIERLKIDRVTLKEKQN